MATFCFRRYTWGASLCLDTQFPFIPPNARTRRALLSDQCSQQNTNSLSANSYFLETSFQFFFLPFLEVKTWMPLLCLCGGGITNPVSVCPLAFCQEAWQPLLKFPSYFYLGFGFLYFVSSMNMLPSASIFKKYVEVFHLQLTFLPNFFTATDLFYCTLTLLFQWNLWQGGQCIHMLNQLSCTRHFPIPEWCF